MLTGEWGSGKSYYVQNELIPFLEGKKKNSEDAETVGVNEKEFKEFQCILISLYGLSTIQEISRSIYIEARTSSIMNQALLDKARDAIPERVQKAGKEIWTLGKGICKTLFKNISGLELNVEPQDFDSLIETVNMAGKLIILEDIERTKIDILDLLGYVNSLVEQDGVKVLLVANEEKFIRIDKDAADEKKEWVQRYLQSKEKTISDTLHFEADTTETIKSILSLFDPELSQYKDQNCINEIKKIFVELRTQNYRSFIFACQKTVDIFEKIQFTDKEFFDCIFYSIIAYCVRLKKGEKNYWPDKRKESSFELGTKKYPLFFFCYKYIVFHIFDTREAELSKEIFKDLQLFDSSKSVNDPDLRIICDYYNYKDDEVKEAIKSISEKLKKKDVISFSEYGALALNLIQITQINDIGFSIEDYSKMEATMVENLCGKGEQISPDVLSRVAVDPNTSCGKIYRASMSKMIDSLLQKDHVSVFGFSYTLDTVKPFHDVIIKDPLSVLKAGGFMSKMNIERLIEVLKKCSSIEINLMKDVFEAVYLRYGIPKEDMDNLKLFRDKLNELKEKTYRDAILKENIKRFILTVEESCNRSLVDLM